MTDAATIVTPPSPLRLQAQIQALTTQRNQALDNNVQLVGILTERDLTIAQLQEANKALQERVDVAERDATRFEFITDDHADPQMRDKVRELIGRMPTMSTAAVRQDVDALMAPPSQAADHDPV